MAIFPYVLGIIHQLSHQIWSFLCGKINYKFSFFDIGPLSFLFFFLAAAAKSLQSCPTLCDPIDSSPPGSPVPGILPARTLEWVTISFSNAWKWKVKGKLLSRVWLFATPWTAAYQAPLSMGFSRQEYWSGVPSPSPFFFLKWTLIVCASTYLFILFVNILT